MLFVVQRNEFQLITAQPQGSAQPVAGNSPFAFISSVGAQSTDSNNVTTGAIDFSAAKLIIVGVGGLGVTATLSSSPANTWSEKIMTGGR